ncbi:uncharacterized protein LOC132301527 [Cornus florida]|uniref:uncharacterized protein LOC132301527 n=1 Tax=Cornus florida TaxID=4283 RepID=UPI0028A0A0A4|nr:uncharacterized protein LOC132301527 [Cornus florida]
MVKETMEVKQAINKLTNELIQAKGENEDLRKHIDKGKRKAFESNSVNTELEKKIIILEDKDVNDKIGLGFVRGLSSGQVRLDISITHVFKGKTKGLQKFILRITKLLATCDGFKQLQLTHVRRQGNRVAHVFTALLRFGIMSDLCCLMFLLLSSLLWWQRVGLGRLWFFWFIVLGLFLPLKKYIYIYKVPGFQTDEMKSFGSMNMEEELLNNIHGDTEPFPAAFNNGFVGRSTTRLLKEEADQTKDRFKKNLKTKKTISGGIKKDGLYYSSQLLFRQLYVPPPLQRTSGIAALDIILQIVFEPWSLL